MNFSLSGISEELDLAIGTFANATDDLRVVELGTQTEVGGIPREDYLFACQARLRSTAWNLLSVYAVVMPAVLKNARGTDARKAEALRTHREGLQRARTSNAFAISLAYSIMQRA